MAALIIIAIVIVGLVVLDAAAGAWGADSRDSLPDDHRWSHRA
jgi:hypothetical protein